jgi:dTDP-4-amino-4,6-dideoxygalactose transaminase
MATNIAFIDLDKQRRRLGRQLDDAIMRVVDAGNYIMGPEVAELERELAAFTEVSHVVACSNGTDALTLALRALGIGPGDAVFVPAFTFAATAEIVPLIGATPVFVDVRADTQNMCATSLASAVEMVNRDGRLRPAAVIPVDLFGQPADYRAIQPLCDSHGMRLVVDAAQGFGCTLDNRMSVAIGDVATTSFFPAKPLGCYGDGGAVFTHSPEVADLMRSLRVHGKGTDKYDNVRVGLNARLDTLQAAILLEKLKIYRDELDARDRVAATYTKALAGLAVTPVLVEGARSVWAQYTVQVSRRDAVQAALKSAGVPTAVYYPLPLNHQTAYKDFPTVPGGTPVSDALAKTVLSLPMHPYLDDDVQRYIIDQFAAAVAANS